MIKPCCSFSIGVNQPIPIDIECSTVLSQPLGSTGCAFTSHSLFNPYGLHSIRQSWIRTLSLSYVPAFTQTFTGTDSEMRLCFLILLSKVT